MTLRKLSCFERFQCLAGSCPDTCCSGWEIDLDEEILSCYRSLPGPLGDELRSKIQTEDGYTFFALEQGRCPFLNGENLCRLILEQGEEALSVTCREHPRFVEEYGALQEWCLSISCPEAARLLLEEPLMLVTEENDAPWEEDWALDEGLLRLLLGLRRDMFQILAAKRPLSERVALLLDCAQKAQPMLMPQEDVIGTFVFRQMDGNEYDDCPAPPLELDLAGFLNTMKGMEFTTPRLRELLEQCTPPSADILFNKYAAAGERLLFYFLYRYVLRAVWDGDLVGKVHFAACSTAAILALAAGPMAAETLPIRAAAILYSREAEHSDENLALLGARVDLQG